MSAARLTSAIAGAINDLVDFVQDISHFRTVKAERVSLGRIANGANETQGVTALLIESHRLLAEDRRIRADRLAHRLLHGTGELARATLDLARDLRRHRCGPPLQVVHYTIRRCLGVKNRLSQLRFVFCDVDVLVQPLVDLLNRLVQRPFESAAGCRNLIDRRVDLCLLIAQELAHGTAGVLLALLQRLACRNDRFARTPCLLLQRDDQFLRLGDVRLKRNDGVTDRHNVCVGLR